MRALPFTLLLLALPAPAQEGARRLADEEQPAAPAAPVITRPPQLLKFVDADYPVTAQAEGLTANVQLVLTLDAEGRVTDAVLAGEPVGHGFDEAAIAAARQFEFSPAEIDGQPAAIRIGFTYRFELTAPPPPPAEEVPADTARIVGSVRERGSRAPVPGAPVGTLSDGGRGAAGLEVLADARGEFALEGLEPGTYELVATSPDHRTERLPVTLGEREEVRVDFLLERLRTSPYETIVRGERDRTSLTRRTLGQEEMRSVPGTFGDPLRAVLNLPGLARPPYVLGVLLVRGSGPADSAVMVDGHEVPLLYHFLGGPSVLPPEMLARIDFFPGNFTVRYGRAIGGVIDVETRRPRPERWQGSVDLDLFDVGGYFEGPITDATAVSGAVRRSHVDAVIRAVDAASDDDLATVLPVYYDYQARVDHRLSPRHAISALVFGSEDLLTLVGDPGGRTTEDVDARLAFHRLKLDWHARPTDALEWTIAPVVGVDLTRVTGGDVTLDTTVADYGLRADVRLGLSETLVLRTGLDFLGRYAFIEGAIPLIVPEYRPFPGANAGDREVTELTREMAVHATALYLEAEWQPGGGPVTLIPGVRADHYRWLGRDRFAVDPRLNFRWALTPEWTLRGGAGLFNQNPVEWRLDEDFGNPDLDLEWAEHYGLGVVWQATEAIRVELDGFFARRHDLVQRVEEAEIVDGELDAVRFANIGEGRSYGLELLVRHDVTRRFYGWVAYTLSRAENRDRPGADYELVQWDQTHILSAVASYRFDGGWEVGARFRLTSGNLTTEITDGTFEADEGDYEQWFAKERGKRQTPFHQLDLRVEKTWTFTAWDIAAYLDIQNVYFATNPELTAYDYRFRESEPIPGIPILPSFGVRARF